MGGNIFMTNGRTMRTPAEHATSCNACLGMKGELCVLKSCGPAGLTVVSLR